MQLQKSFLTLFLAVIALTGLVQCGSQKNKASGAEIAIIPPNPIVITADVTDGNGKIRKAPWFRFEVKIKNGTPQKFEIVAIQALITIVDGNGATSTKIWAVDPGGSNFSTDRIDCKYTTFGTWAVNEDKEPHIAHSNPDCPNGDLTFYVDGLARPASANNFRYTVKIQPLGYFIDDLGVAEDRFEKFRFFYTQ